MIGRLVWFAALFAVAVLTTFQQLDMQSRGNRAFAGLVPEPLRNHAQAWIVQGMINQGNSAQAVTEAKRLVRQSPLPAENITLLAQAQAKSGKVEEAAMSIQFAARRGWREPVAQEAMLRLAIAAGDKQEAARRYAALFLRRATPDALLRELGPAVLGGPDPAARDTLVEVVVGGERWHAAYLRRGAQVMPPAAFASITVDSLAGGAAFDCPNLGAAIRALTNRDAAAGASLRAAAQARCPGIGA